ncbi:outer membrane receptor protein involved in Fe transport [Leeuwenhoekiella aestuarii]|uniref:Outer membrane receptor protein involved in Fe transport n=1 Tax=Leeuwenhoekiella aestuarii TaxID=2249426 RepID=A0A4Q0NUE3_9FLAO|nr:TonB-dependent receptor [Leeuwenhoekiella aestuarii]RXG14183.1 outer membrane receptor protein involved in Fe transport [Leeuwenhoekiella aestuarii]RXG18932.1 outer membrane receptor protein involved in Fe transport [Leeuwenhoekiella aestuarii]
MKQILGLLMFMLSAVTFGQTGTIEGTLSDKEMNNEPLPFANVIIKGTTKGGTTDFDGKYIIENVPVGTYEVEFSFVGYEPVTVPNVVVETGKFTNVSTALGASAAALDEVLIQVQTSRERETALLMEQKNAIEIKESIGAQQLAKQGITDAATATTKISGVTSSEASGDVFIRGLGDRYLYTTMNGLPVPSDDIERKNIDLSLFNTRVIQSLSVSKTYASTESADQASGTVNITSKELSGTQELSVGVRGGINTNVAKSGVFDNFKVSANQADFQAGYLQGQGYTSATLPSQYTNLVTYKAYPRLTQQSWNPSSVNTPLNHRFAISLGKKIGEKLKVFVTASQSTDFKYRQGLFRQFRSNFIDDTITDATNYNRTVYTTAMGNVDFKLNDNNSFKYVSLFVNKLSDEVYEGGRNGEGTIFEETAPEEGLSQFIRDQNTKQTSMWVNQLFGEHDFSERNKLNWGLGFNVVYANEPNRIRNEVNFNDDIVQLGRNGGFQQRKTFQYIDDVEYAGLVKDEITLLDTESQKAKLTLGLNYRNKQRGFRSQFLGITERSTNAINPTSIDDLGAIFTTANFESGVLQFNVIPTDLYDAELDSKSAFAAFNFEREKYSAYVGARYQRDYINVAYDVNNIPGRTGNSLQEYDNLYLTGNFKYNLNEDQSLRVAASRTITLPEFKEIAPFEYVSPTGQITRGNPDIKASTNYNLDLKYEWFPSADQLFSVAGFYKLIEDPINKVQDRGSAGVFSYFNAGNQADIYGIELETRVNLYKSDDDDGSNLRLGLNATRMWHKQDLKEIYDDNGNFIRTFRYKGLTEEGLQGASDYIFNANLNFTTNSENPFDASLVANYASNSILALGAPEIQTESDINYNDAIIEVGYVTLNAIVSKTFAKNWQLQLRALNLLNPEIKRTQLVKPSTTNIETNQIVRSYSLGSTFSLGLTYSL